MKKTISIIFFSLAIVLFFVLTSITVLAEPTVNNITVTPENPEPESTVTITSDISGENITSVNLSVSECNYDTGQCYVSNRYEMTIDQGGKYTTLITLKDDKDRTDHIQYKFTVVDSGVEYSLTNASWVTDLDLSTENDEPNGGENSTDETPGFELLFVLTALFISFLIYYKKR